MSFAYEASVVYAVLHIIFFILKERGYSLFSNDTGIEGQWSLPLTFPAVAVTSGFMSLLLVFFNNQCYTRYFQLYGHCVGLHGSIMEWSALVKLEFGHKGPAFQWNCCFYPRHFE